VFLVHKVIQEKMVLKGKWDHLALRGTKVAKEILGQWVVLDQEDRGEKLVQ